ncbi:unnamed protein product, partial [Acidithrix sp. C25]
VEKAIDDCAVVVVSLIAIELEIAPTLICKIPLIPADTHIVPLHRRYKPIL